MNSRSSGNGWRTSSGSAPTSDGGSWLPQILGIVLLGEPAQAGRLVSLRHDKKQMMLRQARPSIGSIWQWSLPSPPG